MNVNFLDLFENDFLAIFPEIFLLNAIFILLFLVFSLEPKSQKNYLQMVFQLRLRLIS